MGRGLEATGVYSPMSTSPASPAEATTTVPDSLCAGQESQNATGRYHATTSPDECLTEAFSQTEILEYLHSGLRTGQLDWGKALPALKKWFYGEPRARIEEMTPFLKLIVAEIVKCGGYQCLNLLNLVISIVSCGALSRPALALFDQKLIDLLFRLVEETKYGDESEELHMAAVNLLLGLNDQFLLRPKAFSNLLIHNVLLKRNDVASRTFMQSCIFLLNRSSDQTTQMMILKMLFLLLQNPAPLAKYAHQDGETCDSTSPAERAAQFIFTNDLQVLIDIVIRALADIEGSRLRTAYLRVLHILVRNTRLHTQKLAAIRQLLVTLQFMGMMDQEEAKLIDRILSDKVCWHGPEFPSDPVECPESEVSRSGEGCPPALSLLADAVPGATE